MLPARDQVETLVELREHARDLLRVVLQVAVDGDQDVTLGDRKPRHQRLGLAEVTPQANDADLRDLGGETVEDGGRTVPRPVVDEDHLGPLGEVPQYGYQLAGERTDIVALIEHGHDDRNHLIRLGHS